MKRKKKKNEKKRKREKEIYGDKKRVFTRNLS